MYQNYIFDLYGTLIDIRTDEEKKELWDMMAHCYAENGAVYTPRELKKAYVKLCKAEENDLKKRKEYCYPEIKIDRIFLKLFTEKGVCPAEQAVTDIAITFRTLSRDYIRLYPGVCQMLQELKQSGRNVFLLSNAQRLFTMPEIQQMDLEGYFDDIFISSDYGIKKPEKEYMELLLQKHHLQVKDCMMIGNEVKSDIAIADLCGMDSLYFHSSFEKMPSKISATYSMADRNYKNFNSLYGGIKGGK